MPAPADLVYEQSTSLGTGNFVLSSQPGKRSFASAFGTGVALDVFDYFISHRSLGEWEIGTGHMSDATTLVRDTVVRSSNSNLKVNFQAGTKDVTNDIPAAFQVRGPGTAVTNNHVAVFDGTSGSLIKSSNSLLGTIASQAANNVSITGGSISGITDLAIADGGTGASDAATARTNLGAQAADAALTSLAGLSLVNGDILYATGADTLQRLAAGTNSNVLKLVSGIPSWGLPYTVRLQVFTATGPYTPTANLIGAIVVCTGGGGGGTGETAGNTTTLKSVGGGGGGGGATAIRFLPAATIGTANITVTIGGGGAGGTQATTATTTGVGGSGGATSFGALISAAGGSGAPSYTVSTTANSVTRGAGGAGGSGTSTSDTFIFAGGNGQQGMGLINNQSVTGAYYAMGGSGGSSFFTNGAPASHANSSINNAAGIANPITAYGAGGGGACLTGTVNTGQNGSSGIQGACLVFEMYAT